MEQTNENMGIKNTVNIIQENNISICPMNFL